MKHSPTPPSTRHEAGRAGLHRRSCTWLDAVGTGYSVGISRRLLDQASQSVRNGYCR